MKSLAMVVVIMGVAMAFAPSPAAAATFYVNNSSASCSNAGPGTQATPYCTISAALAAHHSPGTTIVVLPGIYHEQVTVPASGASGSPIVLQGQGSPGNPVVVDGADDLGKPSLWVLYSGNVWRAASVTSNPKQVFADNARLAASTAAPALLPAKSFVWVSGQGLYVNVGGGNPGNHLAEVTSRSFNFNVAGCSWVVIDGFTATRSVWAAILATNSNNITITHNAATFGFTYGIQAENSTATVIGSNVASDNLWSGIALTAGSTGCTVQDNESFGNLTPNQSSGIYGYNAPRNLIQGNRVHDNAYNGIMLSTGASNNVLRQNRSWNNAHQGIEDIFCTGNFHVGDVSYGNSWNGFAIEGGATGTTLYNCVAANNGMSNSYTNLEVDASSTSGFTSDDNLFWHSSSTHPVVLFGGASYLSVSAFSAATGRDTRTFQANPRFANAAGGDFRPNAGSPLIDSGNSGVANWPSTDAAGSARVDDPATANTGLGPVAYADRGAFEFQPVGTPNQPPVAKLVLAPTSGVAPLAVNADASGSLDPEGGRIASYRFNFGDGTVVGPQPGATAAHTYATAGTWLASVIVADSVGATATASAADTVWSAPVARLKLTPSSGIAPLAIVADASGSTPSANIISYRFNFGDGTVVGPQPGATAAHTYAAAGTWLASVIVTDSFGGTATASAADTVRNDAPVAALKLTPSSGVAPLAIVADASGSTSPARITSYRFDFGDGTPVVPQSGATAPHTYATAGIWLASVVVTDSVGGTATAAAADTVRNSPPVAALTLTPSSGLAPLGIVADASGSTSSTRITSYRFNFGDGTPVVSQSGATAPHTYTAAGTWLASVVVTDSVGGTATASAADTVRSAPVAVLKITPSSGFEPLAVIADGSGSSSAARIVSYSFNFGDGTPVVLQPGKTATHTYAAGSWTATLTVTDSLGAIGSTSAGVSVAPPPPPPSGGTFYVNNANASCSNTGPGTQTSPFCTISAALTAQHAPGTTIVVMPGIYREQVTVPASGTSGNPIVLRAQGSPGSPVIVDGADDFANPALWTLSSGTVWLASSVTWSPKQVFADSVRLAVSTALPASLPVNSFVWVSGQGLYVNLGGDNPGIHHAEVGHRTYGIYASGRSWLVIDGFTTTRTEAAGVEVTNLSSNVNVTHNVATFSNNYGFQVNNCSAVLFGSNTASDNLWSGIGVTGGSTGCTIQDNESFRNTTPSQSCGIYDYGSPGNLFRRNRTHDNAYTGIKMVGGAINNVLLQNQSWKNAHYGIHDLTSAGNAHVGDVAYGNVSYGITIEGSATGTTLFDCVSTENTGAALLVDATSTSGFASNDNLFWNSVAGTLVKFGGVSYTSVPAYSAASGQDTRTFQANPMFANAAGGDFRPTAGSPLIDAANSGVANWPTTDAAGNARVDDPATANTGLGPVAYADRGALEFQAGSFAARSGSAVHGGGGAATDSSLRAALMRAGGLAPLVAPNPVRTSARLAFRLEQPAPVRIRVFDLGGRLVRTLPSAIGTSAGWNVVDLDGRADNGTPLRSGVYLYEIRAGAQRAVGRFVVMR